jgi:hypothetical protein
MGRIASDINELVGRTTTSEPRARRRRPESAGLPFATALPSTGERLPAPDFVTTARRHDANREPRALGPSAPKELHRESRTP